MSYRRYLSLVTGVLWGTVYPSIVVALMAFTPLEFALLRVGLAGLALGVVLLYWRGREAFRVSRDAVPRLLALSVLGVGAFYVAQTVAVSYSSPINVSFINASHPLLVAAIAPLVLDESVDRVDVLGLVFAVFGVYVIIGNGRLIPLFSSQTAVGDAIALVSSLSFALYLVLHRRWADGIDIGQLSLTFFILAFSTPMLAGALGASDGYSVPGAGPLAVVALLWVAVVATTGGYLALNVGLREETSVLSALRLLLIPFVSTITSALVLGAAVKPIHYVGGVAIAVGIILPHRWGRR